MKYLSETDTSKVDMLNLCSSAKYLGWNDITEIGALHLSRAKWGDLTWLSLCKCNFSETATE